MVMLVRCVEGEICVVTPSIRLAKKKLFKLILPELFLQKDLQQA